MTFAEYLIQHEKFHEDAPYTRKDCMVCDVIMPEINKLTESLRSLIYISENFHDSRKINISARKTREYLGWEKFPKGEKR